MAVPGGPGGFLARARRGLLHIPLRGGCVVPAAAAPVSVFERRPVWMWDVHKDTRIQGVTRFVRWSQPLQPDPDRP